jgi:hypothetical protein
MLNILFVRFSGYLRRLKILLGLFHAKQKMENKKAKRVEGDSRDSWGIQNTTFKK